MNEKQISKQNVLQDEINEAMKKVDLINEIDFNMNVSIPEIINKAEYIRKRKKDRIEFILFLILILSIMVIVSYVSVLGFGKIFLYIEIILLILLPYSIIPAAIFKKVKEA